MKLQEKLYSLRQEQHLTQAEAADKLNVSRQAISKWESGAALPSIDNLLSISKLYGVSVDYLIDEAYVDDNEMAKVIVRHAKQPLIRILLRGIILIASVAALLMLGYFTNTLASVAIALVIATELLMILIIARFVMRSLVRKGVSRKNRDE